MRVLAISAHPDDLEICCGGTIARFAQAGHQVTMCNVATGSRGSFEHSMEEIAAIRLAEAQAGARILGAEHITAGIPDTEVNSRDPEQQRILVELIRKVRPDVILTHSDNDYMIDHRETSRLVEDSSFIASVPLYETESPAIDEVPALFHFDNAAALDFTPTEYVDITDVLELKLQALGEHKSQITWLEGHDSSNVIESTRNTALLRGYQCGVTAAEGFRPSLKHLRLRPYRLLP